MRLIEVSSRGIPEDGFDYRTHRIETSMCFDPSREGQRRKSHENATRKCVQAHRPRVQERRGGSLAGFALAGGRQHGRGSAPEHYSG